MVPKYLKKIPQISATKAEVLQNLVEQRGKRGARRGGPGAERREEAAAAAAGAVEHAYCRLCEARLRLGLRAQLEHGHISGTRALENLKLVVSKY